MRKFSCVAKLRPLEMDIERQLIGLLHRNVPVALPCVVLLFRLLVKWMAREEAKQIFRSVLVVPLDLTFIAVGLVLAGLARTIPTFATKYPSDREADLGGALILFMLLLVAVLLTVFDRWVRVLWEKFYTAWQQIGDRDQLRLRFMDDKPTPNQRPADFPVVARMSWMLVYWSALVPLLFLELAISILVLGAIIRKVL